MVAARRTLPSDYTAQAKAHRSRAVTKLYKTTALKQASLSYRIYLFLFATSLSRASCNAERSASVTIPNFSSSTLTPPWSSGVWRSTRLVTHAAANPMSGSWGAILLRPPAKAHATKLQVLVLCLEILTFCSQVSTAAISTNSHHFDVSVDLVKVHLRWRLLLCTPRCQRGCDPAPQLNRLCKKRRD